MAVDPPFRPALRLTKSSEKFIAGLLMAMTTKS